MENKAVFLDRDGVINKLVYYEDHGILDSPFTVEQFKILPDVDKAIDKLRSLGFKIIVISNQPGIAKGNYDMDTFVKIQEKLKKNLSIDADYYCLHHPDGKINKYTMVCDCRKPKPGLILKAAKDHNIDLQNSWIIGDGITDIKSGQTAGCRTILIGRMKCELCELCDINNTRPDFIAPNLYKASLIIEKEVMGK